MHRPRLKKLTPVLIASLAFGAGGLTVAFASGGFERPTEINKGLVNAANSVLSNLLGNDVGSIRGFNPQPDPPRLVLHLNVDSAIPIDVVFFSKADASSSCTNKAVVSIENGAIKVATDTNSGIEVDTDDNLNLGQWPPGPTCSLEADTN